MVKLAAVPVHVERQYEVYRDVWNTRVIDTHGYVVTFSVVSGCVLGELRLPMQVPPALGEEYEIVIRRKGEP